MNIRHTINIDITTANVLLFIFSFIAGSTDDDVIFTSGDKVEFNRSGEWTEIDCKSAPVPAGIVPAPIVNYVRKNYHGAQIMEIGRKDNYYEVNLSNRLEIKFNKKFQVIEIDS